MRSSWRPLKEALATLLPAGEPDHRERSNAGLSYLRLASQTMGPTTRSV
jgi:hypothetical protein